MTVLCRVDDVPPGGARPIVIGGGTARRDILVLRDAAGVWAFENACPHNGTPLDVLDDDVFDETGEHLVCGTHGALFRPRDGFCVAGPCQGRSLRAVAVLVSDGAVILAP